MHEMAWVWAKGKATENDTAAVAAWRTNSRLLLDKAVAQEAALMTLLTDTEREATKQRARLDMARRADDVELEPYLVRRMAELDDRAALIGDALARSLDVQRRAEAFAAG